MTTQNKKKIAKDDDDFIPWYDHPMFKKVIEKTENIVDDKKIKALTPKSKYLQIVQDYLLITRLKNSYLGLKIC